MDVVGPLLGAGAGLVSAMIQSGNQQTANNINWRAVMEQVRANRKAEQLQQATRRDAYGNELEYIPGVGWTYNLTGMTKNILNAQQGEEYKSLTEDAPRNRAAAVRMDDRSQMADEQFGDVFNDYRYRHKGNEQAEIADATQLLLNSRQKGLSEAASLMARQLMRTGNSSQIASVYKQAGDEYAATLEDAMLRGKQIGKQSYRDSENDAIGRAASELSMLSNLASNTERTPIQQPTYNNDLTGRADSALQQLTQAMQSGGASNANALFKAASGFANSGPDLSGVAGALAKLSFPTLGQNESQVANTQQSDPWNGLRTVRI